MEAFKRKIAEFSGGDMAPLHGTREEWVPKQPVKIVHPHPAPSNEDEEDQFVVETYAGKRYLVDGCDLHPHPTMPETNIEFVTRLMEYSQNGHLMQVFLIEAVAKYAEQVQQMPQDQQDRMNAGMLPYGPWRACADEARTFIESRKG